MSEPGGPGLAVPAHRHDPGPLTPPLTTTKPQTG